MANDYEYRAKSGRGIPLLCLAVVLILGMVGLAVDAPRWVWLALGPTGITLLFLLMGKNRFGMRITDDNMIIGIDPVRQRFSVSNIDALIMTQDGKHARYEFRMKDGKSQYVLAQNMPPPRAIAGQLEMRGIRTEIKDAAT